MNTPTPNKTCITCGETKRLEDFTKDKARKDGHSSYCRLCTRAKQKTPEAKARRKANRQQESVRKKRLESNAKSRYLKRHGTLEGFTYKYRPIVQIKAEAKKKRDDEVQNKALRATQREAVSKSKPWLNTIFSKTESYRIRYKLDPKFMLKERLKRQLAKKLARDRPEERPSLKVFAQILEATPGVTVYTSPCVVERILGYPLEDLLESLTLQFKTGMSLSVPSSWQIDHDIPQRVFNLSDPKQVRECWALGNLQPLSRSENSRKARIGDRETAELFDAVSMS